MKKPSFGKGTTRRSKGSMAAPKPGTKISRKAGVKSDLVLSPAQMR